MANPGGLTPLRIRGKRRSTPAEKWNAGRCRKPKLQLRPRPVEHASTHITEAKPAKSRKRRHLQDDSPLENLPAEILQAIFDYAGNVDLPVVSQQLAAKLSKSQHLRTELTSRLLTPVLEMSTDTSSATDRRAATRLLNSRFMTWQFFKNWLSHHPAATTIENMNNFHWALVWSSLHPSRALMPPTKLLIPPFSEDKVAFLSTLIKGITDIAALDSSYAELAYDGLVAAINAGSSDVVSLLLGAGLRSSTELLRIAVADAGCNQDIVRMIVSADTASQSNAGRSKGDLDFLDPVIWSWAEQVRKQGNSRGSWLISFLRDLQRKHISGRQIIPNKNHHY